MVPRRDHTAAAFGKCFSFFNNRFVCTNIALKADQLCMLVCKSQFGRVVKAWDLKSHGVTRAGSNPAADVRFLYILNLLNY